MSHSSNSGAWAGPVLLTENSPYEYNYQPAVNADGTKVLFDSTDAPYSGNTRIYEVGTDGTGFGWCPLLPMTTLLAYCRTAVLPASG